MAHNFREEIRENPEILDVIPDTELELLVTPLELAAVRSILLLKKKINLAEDRLAALSFHGEIHLSQWMHLVVFGFGTALNIGMGYTITLTLPWWLQIPVLLLLSAGISYACETSIAIAFAKFNMNVPLEHRKAKLNNARHRNSYSRDMAADLADFIDAMEHQVLTLWEFVGLLIIPGEVIAITFTILLMQPPTETHQEWLVQFVQAFFQACCVGFIPAVIAVLLSYFEYQPRLRHQIVRGYRLFLTKNGYHHQPNDGILQTKLKTLPSNNGHGSATDIEHQNNHRSPFNHLD